MFENLCLWSIHLIVGFGISREHYLVATQTVRHETREHRPSSSGPQCQGAGLDGLSAFRCNVNVVFLAPHGTHLSAFTSS